MELPSVGGVIWRGKEASGMVLWPSRTDSTCSTHRPNADGLSARVLHAVKASVVKPDASNTPHLTYKHLFIPKHVLLLSFHNTYNQRAGPCSMLRPLSSYHSFGNNGMAWDMLAEPCLESCQWKSKRFLQTDWTTREICDMLLKIKTLYWNPWRTFNIHGMVSLHKYFL